MFLKVVFEPFLRFLDTLIIMYNLYSNELIEPLTRLIMELN